MARPPPNAQAPILKKLKYSVKNIQLLVARETIKHTAIIIQKKDVIINALRYFLFLINNNEIQPIKPNNSPTNKPKIKNNTFFFGSGYSCIDNLFS